MQTRVLCLGNDLMADDAVGPSVARRLRSLGLPGLDVVESPESGLRLLDYLEIPQLIVVDAVSSGGAPPGTVYILDPQQLPSAQGVSPHYAGLQEALLLGRALGMAVAEQVTVLAVETADCLTVGGPMSPAVERAVSRVVDLICQEVALPSVRLVAAPGGSG
jgi:hydrogenase maturation protease